MSDPPSQTQRSAEQPGAESGRGWETAERTVYAVLAALVTVAAPLFFYRLTLPHGPDDVWLTPWFVAPIMGPMVFQLISRPSPKMRYGLAFAGLLAVVFGVWAGIQVPFKEPGGWPLDQRLAIGGYIFVITFVGGLLGAVIAHVLTQVVGPDRARKAGALIVILDVVAAAILVGVLS